MLSFHSSFKYIIVLIFTGLIIACSQSLYIPTTDTVANPLLVDDLTAGRKLYIQHCGSCHNLYRPEEFTKEKWTAEMGVMKVEAKINDRQAELILQYVTGYRHVQESGD